ncbi:hypothetical protein [Streptomyces sp. NBC_00728]|uniref:hypothetical protein n=1 Tax=Streptomyces sp. NBC_00728 TaxID=2903676 RepID=UPI0038667B76
MNPRPPAEAAAEAVAGATAARLPAAYGGGDTEPKADHKIAGTIPRVRHVRWSRTREISADRIGEAYAKGGAKVTSPRGAKVTSPRGAKVTSPRGVKVTPPREVKYPRSPDGAFGIGQDAVVQEIHSVNR